MEHTKNHEKRPAIFPVKTLDSLTVVATPAAPTCLVGGTTSVALVVTANYLTGTATSEAVVTTYTTGSNWANGVFTAATTVAGTENIVVSYTEGGVTKTANVAVTVSVEAPVVTTVTVTLPSTIVEASSTQAVVLVKDQFGATMTTGFTTTYAITTGTSTSTTAGLVTAGSYDANTAANNAHVLTVTATPTTGTAVTGTANFTVTADSTKPTIVSVQAIDNKNIVVTYDKKVSSSATTVANYSLYHSTTGVTGTLQSGNVNDANKEIKATALFTDATNKIVKITIVDVSAALGGYPAEGLDAVNYRLYVSNVVDTTSNANTIIASSNVQFMGTTTPDSNKPVINAMAYNKGTGTLVITLDKAVTNALVYTNIKFNGTVLTAAVTNNDNSALGTNKISVTLASADRTTVSAITGDITVTILVDAIADANGNKNVETSMVASLTVPPTMTGAVYDEATNTLSMGFSQTLDLSTSTLRAKFTDGSSLKMKSTEFAAVALSSTDTLLTTSNATTVSVLLSNDHANAFEAVTTHTSPKVIVAADAFKNTTGDYNLKADDSTTDYPAPSMTVVKDTEKPAVTSITYDETTKKLVLNFNVNVSRTFTNANVLFFYDKDTKTAFATQTSLTGLTPTEVSDGKTLTFDLSAAGAATNLATDLKTAQQGPTALTTPTTYNSFVTFVADTFTKSGSLLKNVAVTDKATATTVTYTDNVAPALSSSAITVTNQATISFTFDEKVNKTDAETAANYKIYLGSTTTTLAVNSVKMTDYDTSTNTYTQKTVQIVTGTQTSGQTYRLVVSNVKDLAGNTISSTDTVKYQKEFTGSSTAAPAPKVVSAKIRDNGNQSLDTADYIAVTFDRPVKLNTSSTQTTNQNFDLTLGTADFPASYNKSNVTMSTETADLDCVVLIKVDSAMVSGGASPVTVGQDKIDVLGGDLIKDKYSDVAAAAGTAVIIQSPLGATTITEAMLTDVDNSGTVNKGDTLKVTFSNPLYVVTGTIAATNVVTENSRSLGTDATINTTMTTSVASNTLTVTMGESPTLLPTDVLAGEDINITDQFLKDSWGIKVASTVKKAITTATVAAPYITKAEWVDVDGSGTGSVADYVYYTFNVPVYLNSNGTAGNGAGAVNCWKYAGADFGTTSKVTKVVSDAKMVRVEFAGAAPTLTPTVTAAEIGSALGANLTNYAGNNATAATTTVKISVMADTVAPTITSAEFISENKLKVVFSEPVNISAYTTVNVTDNNTGTKGLSINKSDARELRGADAAFDSADATGKTVIFKAEADASIAEQTNGISASTTTGLFIGTTSYISDLAGNALAATATGATYTAIAKDATAADYAALAYELSSKKAQLIYSNAGGTVKEKNTNAIACGELALLEVYFAASAPASSVTAAATSAAFATSLAQNGTLISSITAQTAAYKIYYRLSDRAANKSAWIDSGSTVIAAPAAAALADLAFRKGATGGKYEVKRVDATTAGDLTASMDVLVTIDNGTTLTKCGATDAASAYTAVADLGDVTALAAGNITPKYAYRDANGNVSALSSTDGTIPTISSAAATDGTAGSGQAAAATTITVTTSAAVTVPAEILQASISKGQATTLTTAGNSKWAAALLDLNLAKERGAGGEVTAVDGTWHVAANTTSSTTSLVINTTANPTADANASQYVLQVGTTGTDLVLDGTGGNFLVPSAAIVAGTEAASPNGGKLTTGL